MTMKIEFTAEQVDILERFAREKSTPALLIKEVLKAHLNDLINVMNVDKKGNVGLQTCARQEAAMTIQSILDNIFPDDELRSIVKPNEKKNQYR
jgi:hypothetical protein